MAFRDVNVWCRRVRWNGVPVSREASGIHGCQSGEDTLELLASEQHHHTKAHTRMLHHYAESEHTDLVLAVEVLMSHATIPSKLQGSRLPSASIFSPLVRK